MFGTRTSSGTNTSRIAADLELGEPTSSANNSRHAASTRRGSARSTRLRVTRRLGILLAAAALSTAACNGGTLGTASIGNDTVSPPPPPPPPAAVDGVELNEAEKASLDLLNQLRAGLGLGPVSASADLSEFAESWSIEMSGTGFRHSTREDWGHLLDGTRTGFGENIVYTSDTRLSPAEVAKLFHDLWVDSPGHYANMTREGWTEAGIGIHKAPNGWFGTHNFSNG
jgi:uncharacterized protein YkwD